MIALLVSLLVVAAFAGLVYWFAPTPGERWGAMLERYRPHAPMSDWSVGDYDYVRQHADLAAIHARHDLDVTLNPAHRVRTRRSALSDLADIPCRQETVQF
ncbi:hypothetical protein [Nocardia sp. NPDC127526]|uniref:hypothetical protein n=1 Tax=Nocardia sp. NPDC127526 TaxID=3345393 RepID=UPI00362A6B89